MPPPTQLGTVTKTNNGPTPYIARLRDGTTAGFFDSVRKAQVPVEAQLGGRLLRWTRSDLEGGIEFWYAEQP